MESEAAGIVHEIEALLRRLTQLADDCGGMLTGLFSEW
jgi:hypothetical protein